MGFKLTDLLYLSLRKERLPEYSGLEGKEFPEKIPFKLIGLCFFNSLLKLSIPLILEETYSAMSGQNVDTQQYLLLVGVVILAIGLSQLVLIAYSLVLSLYRHHVKKVLSSRILANNFKDYRRYLQAPTLHDPNEHNDMELWMKIGTRLSVYLHNYYESYLSLIFECFNIVVIVIYLIYKLSFSLVFGLAIAGVIMYKTIRTAAEMNNIRFGNIQLRSKRLKILENFFGRISEFKMCWLDKWVYERVTRVEEQFQKGLRSIKLLDCWCVALWQFTSVGISCIVISAYYLFGFNESVDKDSVFTPSTFVYLLNMLNYPLNALSWYIAGIKTAMRAIEELKEDIRINKATASTYTKIQVSETSICVREPIELIMHGEMQKEIKSIRIPQQELRKNKIYSFVGEYSEEIMKKLVFLFDGKCKKSYVEENAWLAPSALDTFSMDEDIRLIPLQQQTLIGELMQLMECHDIPLNTNTQHYSGGEKLRISLVRALNLGEIIVINTNLNSLDEKMKLKVRGALRKLVDGCYKKITKEYTIFIRDNVEISDFIVSTNKKSDNIELTFKLNPDLIVQQEEISKIDVFPQIIKYVENSTFQRSIQYAKKQEQVDRLPKSKVQLLEQEKKQRQQKSLVTFDTFKIYYQSKKHIIFAVSMLFVTLLSNYYNYYISTYIDLSEYNQNQVIVIVSLTIVFAFGLFFRSYYFADANLDESSRICHNLNRNILMDQLSFYQSEEKVKQQSQTINSKSKLICALTSDTETIADHFPFSTNIFANNIAVILSSMIVISIEVPKIMVLMILLIYYCHMLNEQSHKKDEHIKMAIKEKEVEVYKIISDIEGGRKYLIIHNKFEHFSKIYCKLRDQLIEIDWMSDKYRNYINLKYKSVMILFLVVAVALYSFVNVFNSEVDMVEVVGKTAKSSGLALLIQYTIQLSNYLLHFTMSIWEIKGQALSLQRVRPYLNQKASINNRIEAADRVIQKIRSAHSSETNQVEERKSLVKIDSLKFAYESNPQTSIFNNLTLDISKGDKFIIRGRSGSGKTTLYKLLTSAYPKILNIVGLPFTISFSPQHPLLLPDTSTIEQNLNPYKIPYKMPQIARYRQKYGLTGDSLKDLSYEQKIIVNNLRAYLYGYKGIIIYDEPQLVAEDHPESTYLIVTHHHDFKNNGVFQLQDGRLIAQRPRTS